MKQIFLFIAFCGSMIALQSCQSDAGNASSVLSNTDAKVSGSGKDTYLEMTSNTQTGKRQNAQMSMLIKYYISAGGKGRSEMSSLSQLTKITHDNFPANLFEVPKDYKQTEGF